ncbi:hypothetical protein ACHAXR_004731 [Thalassiosira sp. AJA248-18]
MAPTVPPSLKKIKVFLTRATELDRDKGNPESRVVAYNCRQYAVLTGIPLAGQDAAAKNCLGELLNQLEKEKEAMSVFSKAEHWKICRKVADRGEDERKGEEEQRRIYCKWKATDILNAIKEGRTPTPGGYQQEEVEEMALPLVGPPADDSGLPSISENFPPSSINDDFLPPAPSMPSSDFFSDDGGTNTNETNEQTTETKDISPPPYNGIELNINGDPTPTVEDVNEGDEDSGDEDIFIPGAAKAAADNIAKDNNIFVDAISPVDPPPPPYPDHAAATSHVNTTTPSILPPPAASKPLPPPLPPAPAPSSNSSSSTGMFSSLFGKSSNSNKLTKVQLADAVELTKFALAALQKGDGDLGRERLEQALGVWRSKHSILGKLSSHSRKSISNAQVADAAERTKIALVALQKGDGDLGKERLGQALGAWR